MPDTAPEARCQEAGKGFCLVGIGEVGVAVKERKAEGLKSGRKRRVRLGDLSGEVRGSRVWGGILVLLLVIYLLLAY